MEHSFHHMMMKTYMTFQNKILDKTGKEGLLPGQPKVLDFLSSHSICEQKEIAKGCCLKPATITGILNRMEISGLIERKQLHGNRRSYYISLTDKGNLMVEKTSQLFAYYENIAFQGLTQDEQEMFMNTLEKIYMNLMQEEV